MVSSLKNILVVGLDGIIITVLPALTEDPSSVPSSYMAAHNFHRIQFPFLASTDMHITPLSHPHTHMHTIINDNREP